MVRGITMLASKWLYEFMLFIFMFSIFGYFIDFIKHNPRVNKLSLYLLSFVWFIQTSILLRQMIIEKSFPIMNLQDGLFFYSWILVIISLIVNYLFRVHFVVLFMNVFSFFILLLSLSMNATTVTQGQASEFIHEILIIHITLALLSYGFFTLSFIFAFMYLLQYYLLKQKKGLKFVWRFNDLEKLDTYSFYSILIGVPLLSIGLLFGVVWAYVAEATFYWTDIKTVGSLIVLSIYILYLIVRLTKGYQGKPISRFNCGAFLFLLINFFLLGSFSDFHF